MPVSNERPLQRSRRRGAPKSKTRRSPRRINPSLARSNRDWRCQKGTRRSETRAGGTCLLSRATHIAEYRWRAGKINFVLKFYPCLPEEIRRENYA